MKINKLEDITSGYYDEFSKLGNQYDNDYIDKYIVKRARRLLFKAYKAEVKLVIKQELRERKHAQKLIKMESNKQYSRKLWLIQSSTTTDIV